MPNGIRKTVAVMLIVAFLTVTGCASSGGNYAVNINGVPVKDDKIENNLFAGPGVPAEKKWYQKPGGKVALIVLGAIGIGLGIAAIDNHGGGKTVVEPPSLTLDDPVGESP